MILDVVIIAIIAIMSIVGAKRGAVGLLLGLLSGVLASVLIFMLAPTVLRALSETPVYKSAVESVTDSIYKRDVTTEEDAPTDPISSIVSEGKKAVKTAADAAMYEIAKSSATAIVDGVSLIIVFILFKLGLGLVFHLLNSVAKLPVITNINSFLGIGVGAAYAFFIILAVLAVLRILNGEGQLEWLNSQLNGAKISQLLYDNNILFNLFS